MHALGGRRGGIKKVLILPAKSDVYMYLTNTLLRTRIIFPVKTSHLAFGRLGTAVTDRNY